MKNVIERQSKNGDLLEAGRSLAGKVWDSCLELLSVQGEPDTYFSLISVALNKCQ